MPFTVSDLCHHLLRMSVCSTTAAASTKQVRRDNRNPNTRTRAHSSHRGMDMDKRDGQGQRKPGGGAAMVCCTVSLLMLTAIPLLAMTTVPLFNDPVG